MSDYQSFSWRAVDLGLDLRDASDRVQEGRWVRLDNARPSQEALLTSRVGRTTSLTFPGGDQVHTVKRLSDSTLLVGVGAKLYRNGTVYTYGGSSDLFSGNPLTIIPYKPERGTDVWAYVADSTELWKVHEDGRMFFWGIAPPNSACGATISGTGGLDDTVSGASAYDWRFTYYSTVTGAESNGSPIMGNKVTAGSGTGANVSVTASPDPQVDTIRLYRRGGTIPKSWRLTVSGPNTTGIIRDENTDEDIALNQSLSEENDVPFTTVNTDGSILFSQALPYMAGPFIGKYILAVGDSRRPGYFYWTNAGAPDGASSANNVQISSPTEPLIGVVIHNGAPYVMSRDNFYRVDFGQQGITFRGSKTAVGRGLAAPWAHTSGPEIFFLSQDGIYRTSGEEPASSITNEAIRPIFEGVTIGEFLPIDFDEEEALRLHYVGQELHFLYIDTDGDRQHLVWNSAYDRWRSASSAFPPTSVYGDENQSKVRTWYGTATGLLQEEVGVSDSGQAFTTDVRTGSIDLEQPGLIKEWGNVILDADPAGGIITLTPYFDAESSSLPPITLTGVGRQKFSRTLEDTYAHSIAFDISWLGSEGITLYQLTVLWREDEEAIRHWEFPPTSHGLEGWQHLRDGYITVRSQAELEFTIEVDGVSFTPVFRSDSDTLGEKTKLYFDMPPVKGKLFRYIIDSEEDFRIYGGDCEIRTKPWNTSLGYQLVSPFRKEG